MERPLIELTPRLRALADRVIVGAPMADIGTDHALLPAWLVAQGKVPRAIGIDVHEGPLRGARAAIGPLEGVDLRRGDGMSELRRDEVATIVIAGMGGARIRRLVDAGVPTGVERLVLQPNTEWATTRAWIAARGFPLQDEALVTDRGKTYLVLVVRPLQGPPPPWTDADLELGPRLRHDRDPTWCAWVVATRDELRRNARASASAAPEDRQRAEVLRRLQIFESAALQID